MNAPTTTEEPPARAGSLAEAYEACLALSRSHYENFPVASRLVPKAKRGAVAAVYAFARIADDFADEPGPGDAERLRRLAGWRARLRACRSEHGGHPVFWALGDAMAKFDLPEDPFDRLITAFEMDVAKSRRETFADLLFYCRHSADPVGELVLRIFGQWTPQRGLWSDALCTGLQLANFWQDVSVDAARGRLYIPLEDLERRGVPPEEAMRGPASAPMKELMAEQVERARGFFLEGRPLCADVSPRLGLELRLVWLGGTGVLDKIRGQGFDVWSRRPRLKAWDWLTFAPRLLSWT
jgi:hydroxysqualene synthase